MALNNITYGGLGDLRLTETLSAMTLLSLADRDALMQHPALIYLGDARDSSSLTIKAAEISWLGADQLSAVAEGASVTNTALTDNSYTCTVGRYAKSYSPTDLAKLTDTFGLFDPTSFAADATSSSAMTLTNLIAALGSGFSQSVGSSGSNLTVANIFAARALQTVNDVQGRQLVLIHGQQWEDWITGLRAETGALEHHEPTVQQIALMGTGFKGSYLNMDFFVSNQVPTANAGADRAGMMIGRGAVLWADGSHKPDPAVVGVDLAGGKIRLEFDRDGKGAETAAITNRILGVVEGIDLAGVGIVTDA